MDTVCREMGSRRYKEPHVLDEKTRADILDVLDGVATYYVGGCVRDQLLGTVPKDCDFVVVGSRPEDMLARGFAVHGIEHSVFIHRERASLRGFEFGLARREKKVAAGYKGFDFEYEQVGLEDDLSRRDLTINAMAIDVGSGELIDPFGGREHLEERSLQHVSDAFSEDPLRVLRLARFLARYGSVNGWRVAPRTIDLCVRLVDAGELRALTPERISIELRKVLVEPHPSDFLRFLHAVGALGVVLPELSLYGIPQPEHHHPEVDTGIHLELVLDQVARLTGDALTRYGALVHDVGKKLTPLDVLPKHIGHETRGIDVAKALARRLRLPVAYEEFGMLVSELHTFVHRALEMTPGKIVKKLMKLDRRGIFRENVERLTLVAEADARGRKGLEERRYPQADFVRRAAAAYAGIELRADLVAALRDAPQADKGQLGERLRAALRQDRVEAVRAVPRS